MINSVAPFNPSENPVHYAKWPWGLSFPMVRIPVAQVVWSNRRLPFEAGEQALLDEFAWHIPVDKAHTALDGATKTFYAECYGGDSIQYNGGGARCAWSGDWLVKGIGINLLSGYSDEDAAEHRRNGRAGVAEVLVEAIWGEVLHYALPYGAVRMTAVVRTDEHLCDPMRSVAGLGIRQFAWRPANFMRAHMFHVRPENRERIPSDTARVKQAIAHLPTMLPMPASLSETEVAQLEPLRRLKIGLEEMMRRFAEQLGASKAKRLSHGTLSTSNMSIDGRWNDLNSISALPSYGFRRNMAPFWADHVSLTRAGELLCFYIGKYFPVASDHGVDAMPTAAWIQGVFSAYYEAALARRFVAVCGYPQIVADRVWAKPEGQTAMRALSKQLIALARSGHSPRRPYDDEMEKNRVSGDYDLVEIVRRMSAAALPGRAAAKLDDVIQDAEVRKAFVQRYCAVDDMMRTEAHSQGVAAAAFARLVAINCNKAGRNIPFLFRNVIFRECGRLVETYQEIGELRRQAELMIQPVIDEARVVFQDPSSFTTLLWCIDEMTLEYDAIADLLIASLPEKQYTFPRIPTSDLPSEAAMNLLSAARNYWGRAYEEILH